jgi:hypothetical protein
MTGLQIRRRPGQDHLLFLCDELLFVDISGPNAANDRSRALSNEVIF